jgi:hypothetical protein
MQSKSHTGEKIMSGDALARGARSATFGPPNITKEKWDAIWEDDGGTLDDKNEKDGNEATKFTKHNQ